MTEAQKEVLQAYLDDEKQVLKDIKANYEEAIRGIDAKLAELMGRNDSDMANVIYQIDFQKALKAQNEAILEQLQSNNFETVSEYLQKCYENGFVGAMYDLQSQGIPLVIPLDQAQVVKAIKTDSKLSKSLYESFDMAKLKKDVATEIARGFASSMNYAEIARNIQNRAKISQSNAVRIARTEGHRIQCTASMDACEKAKSKGADIVKQWDATLDSRTRESHRMVDGEIRELDEKFSNGLRFPSDPMGSASEVINCRCALLQRARWALDESELETLKERAKVHGLYMDEETAKEFGQKKAMDFAQFKNQYLKATDDLDDSDGISKTIKKAKDYVTRNNPPISLGKLAGEEADEIRGIIENMSPSYKELINSNSRRIRFAKTDAIGGARSNDDGIYVNLLKDKNNPKGRYTSVFHEIGHRIDKIYKNPSMNGAFGQALRNDFDMLVNGMKRNYNMSSGDALAEINKIFAGGSVRGRHIISDLLSAYTNGEYGSGHDASYWARNGAFEREAFAHLFSAESLGYTDKIDTVKAILPNAYGEYTKIVKGMK